MIGYWEVWDTETDVTKVQGEMYDYEGRWIPGPKLYEKKDILNKMKKGINDIERFKESIDLITKHLVKIHKDKDENSLFCRFNELIVYIEDMEICYRSTWNSYLRVLNEK